MGLRAGCLALSLRVAVHVLPSGLCLKAQNELIETAGDSKFKGLVGTRNAWILHVEIVLNGNW